jgi:hypothetical protein
MSDEHERMRFRHADAATGKAGYRRALESLDLTPQELLLGKVDEDGDILWSGRPDGCSKMPAPGLLSFGAPRTP